MCSGSSSTSMLSLIHIYPTKLGAPEGHVLDVREVRLSAGAGFVVAICGDLMTMPGLPRAPAAEIMSVDVHGNIHGLS